MLIVVQSFFFFVVVVIIIEETVSALVHVALSLALHIVRPSDQSVSNFCTSRLHQKSIILLSLATSSILKCNRESKKFRR